MHVQFCRTLGATVKSCCERDPEYVVHTAQHYNGLQQERQMRQGAHVRRHNKRKFYGETDTLNTAKMVMVDDTGYLALGLLDTKC